MGAETAEIILVNASTVFIEGKFKPDTYVVISHDRITQVGVGSQWRSHVSKNTEVVDCDGGTLLPGFIDTHCHPMAMALMHSYIDCKERQIVSLEDLASAVTPMSGASEWIRVANYPSDSLHSMHLDCHRLDSVTQSAPLLLIDDTGQTCIMNSEALKRTGINHGPDALAAANYGLNLRGIFTGNDKRVSDCVPPLSETEIEAGVRALNRKLLSFGITSVHDTSWTNGLDSWRRYNAYKQAGILTPRVQMMAGAQLLDQFVAEGLSSGYGKDGLCLGAAKIAVDELLGTEQPDAAIVEFYIRKALDHRFQLSLHTGSSYLLKMALEVLDSLASDGHPLLWPIRFEHCPVCPPSLWNKLHGNGKVLVMQPALFYEFSIPEAELTQQGAAESWYPIKSLLEAGISVAFSSDAPLGILNPLTGIYVAWTRNTCHAGSVYKSESIGLECAIDLYTRAGGYLDLSNSQKTGQIASGMKADLVLMDRDFSCIDPKGLLDSRVNLTLVDGKLVAF